jgi:hypothetical protein
MLLGYCPSDFEMVPVVPIYYYYYYYHYYVIIIIAILTSEDTTAEWCLFSNSCLTRSF